MSPAPAAGLQIALVLVALALVHVPLGDYMARMFTASRHNRAERGFYRILRIDPAADQRWSTYLLSVLAFSMVSILLLWGLLSINSVLPFGFGTPNMPAAQGFNTAVSFVTNTNWQSYAGETALGYTVQAIGLTVQNFLSAAVGMAVVAALIRGFTRRNTDRLGNFWVDLTRISFRLLLPLSLLAAIVLLAAGVIQNLNAPVDVSTMAGGAQTLPGGLVASQEAIKELGPTAAATSMPTPPTRSRTPPRSPICSRSSCCWRSRSRCRGPSAGWSTVSSRDWRSWRSWWCCTRAR